MMSRNHPLRNRLAVLFAACTVAAMALFFQLYDPWIAIGPDRIEDGGFETPECTAEWTGWSPLARRDPNEGFKHSAGVVLGTTTNRHGALSMTIDTDNIPAFRVSVRAQADGVRPGQRGWHLPRTVFFYRSLDGKGIFNQPHSVFTLQQDARWKHYSEIFPVPPQILNAQLRLQNLGREGTLRIDNISVVPVAPRPATVFIHIFFALLWIAAFGTCLLMLEPWLSLTGTLALLCALSIIIGVLLPGEFLNNNILKSAEAVQDTVERIAPPPAEKAPQPAPAKDKTQQKAPPKKKSPPKAVSEQIVEYSHSGGHFAMFMVLTIFSMLSWAPTRKPLRGIPPVLAGLLLFAASTEVLQLLTPDRTATVQDWLIDLSGILLSAAIMTGLSLPFRLRRRPRNPHRQTAPY